MDFKIEVYSRYAPLKNAFKTASGILTEKQILQLLFWQGEHPVFLFELALSPSLGEMPPVLLEQLSREGGHLLLENVQSKMVHRAVSYFKGLVYGALPEKRRPLANMVFKTIPIGETACLESADQIAIAFSAKLMMPRGKF